MPLPLALQGRGLDSHAGALPLACYIHRDKRTGERRRTEDGLFGITDPVGNVVAIKLRAHTSRKGGRYRWLLGGEGLPPWCSPCIYAMDRILVIEGPLNGMVAWLATADLYGVIGMDSAGEAASIYPELLRDRHVRVYADGDKVGLEARERWARTAHLAGARSVEVLAPLEGGMDFCDIAGRDGLAALRYLLGVES